MKGNVYFKIYYHYHELNVNGINRVIVYVNVDLSFFLFDAYMLNTVLFLINKAFLFQNFFLRRDGITRTLTI